MMTLYSTSCYGSGMRVFLVPQVARLTRKNRLPAAALCRTAREVLAGRLGAGEADLGRGLFKKRVARPGGGKSGGYRMIVACRRPGTDRILFTYAFAKNAAATVTPPGDTTRAGGIGERRASVPDRRRPTGRNLADVR